MSKKKRSKSASPADVGFASDAGTLRFLGGLGIDGGYSNTGIPVTPRSALTAAPVMLAVRALSDDIGKMPLLVERRQAKGGWVTDADHPLNAVLARPNRWHTEFSFKAYAVTSYAMRGNSFTVVLRDGRGRVRALVPVSPDQVQVQVSQRGVIVYQITHPLIMKGESIWVEASDVMHTFGVSLNGYTGVSPISVAAESIGVTLATQQHGARLFSQGARPGGILSTDQKLSDIAITNISKSWKEAQGGLNGAHRTAVLEAGMKYQPVSMSNDDAQFLETRQFQIPEIARWFRVPPSKLFDFSEGHYDNVESQERAYINDALMPITTRFEQEWAAKLLSPAEQGQVRIRFDYDALVRANQVDRYNAYQVGLNNGILNRNEVRAAEGMTPVPGGDEYRVSVQSLPLDANGQLQQPNPSSSNPAADAAEDDAA
ncbi:phage portal protein [Roseicella sp. DB1501]|uniref:phage portal protein n=1 Tax=Roseicella sp. DB1501 TaxID=2730925 RepID=UPI001492D0BA|nr:phage portal protein [Roseicella sp. DB1501]NOG69802.1 phage portal protein [Roseicella sp. DB1501]